jgi:signal transduction histidine kinase
MPVSEQLNSEQIQILVVDDDPELCNLVRDILVDYQVDVVQDGSQVSAKFSGKEYHILISDLHMPGVGGLELLQTLKPHYPGLEMIMLTGGGSVEIAVQAMKHGAAEFLLKPVRVAELRAAVKRATERLRIGRENRLLRDLHEKRQFLEDLRERFVTLLSHELRTPLTTLRFVADELATDSVSEEDRQEILDAFNASVESLEMLADDMRWLAESPQAPLPLIDQSLNPPRMMQQLLRELSHRLGDRGEHLKYEGPDGFAWQGDPRRLRQIVTELLNNAVRASDSDGVIVISLGLDDRDLLIEVIDSGVGIPASKIPTIFEPFQTLNSIQTHHSTENRAFGNRLGVGLSIIRDVIDRMGGTIGIVSNSNEGCHVQVRLKENASGLQIHPQEEGIAEKSPQPRIPVAPSEPASTETPRTETGVADPMDEIINI